MKVLYSDDLADAYRGSYYTLCGAGLPLEEWVSGYERLLGEREIGKPVEWFQTTGEAVNAYAATVKRGPILLNDRFKPDLTLLMFPLTDLHVGHLAMFKIIMQDRWFEDIIDDMRVARG